MQLSLLSVSRKINANHHFGHRGPHSFSDCPTLLRVRARVVLRLCRMCVYVLTPATCDCAEPERAEIFHRSDENRQSRKRRNIETFEVYGRTVATDVGISAHRLSQK